MSHRGRAASIALLAATCAATAFTTCLVPSPAVAALPPWAQMLNDLQVLVDFIAAHDEVAESLRLIDMESHTIHYDEDCMVVFVRGEVEEVMPGPAPDLEFSHSTCELEN